MAEIDETSTSGASNSMSLSANDASTIKVADEITNIPLPLDERILAAARDDNEDLLLEVFEQGNFDINCQDGLGNTPLHNAVMHGSTDVLEHILSHEDCDVDPINRIDKATPLHLALQIPHVDLRYHIFESLLEAGADTSIKDKNGETVVDLLPLNDTKLATLVRKSRAQASVSRDDVASDGEEEGGSGSGSDED